MRSSERRLPYLFYCACHVAVQGDLPERAYRVLWIPGSLRGEAGKGDRDHQELGYQWCPAPDGGKE